jgi:hypothetical protein
VNEPWIVSGLLVGRQAVLQRFGATARERRQSTDEQPPPPNFVLWDQVVEIRDDGIRLDDEH